MAVFKCKMCGGALDIQDGSSVAVCSSCGTKQTIPKLDNETRVNLYDRANHFRRNNDYDKAMSIYEQLLEADKTDAEAYWSIVLCKYGIEYVEDPKTRKMVPTINRAQYTSIFADENYKSALKYADGYQRTVYESEAKELDTIQKGILAISQKEEPFDVFICYKETDVNGRRTHDSVLAQDLYFQLKQEGFKVFFSRITLEDKLGVAYEPYIFAALNTAKVMVVVGTSKENLNAVWVKNEWSRFLALIKNDNSKVLIPAYRDMDPYDLPEEFSHLQAQDMSKLGFMQDLIRGIKKIARTTKPQQTVVVEKAGAAPANIDALLKRAYMFLQDGDGGSANKYAERVLDIDPECSKAYVVKLLAKLKVRKLEDLSTCEKNLSQYPDYHKALQFSDETERKELEGYNTASFNDIKLKIMDRTYSGALDRVAPSFVGEKELKQSIAELRSISGYKDTGEQIAKLEQRLEDHLKKVRKQEQEAEEAKEKAKERARKRKIAKVVACLLVCVIVALAIAVPILIERSAHVDLSDTYELILHEGELIIVGLKDNGNSPTELIIPEEIDGYPVVEIGKDAFKKIDSFKKVVIPDSVRKIGKRAFKKCCGLEEVYIGNGTEVIEKDAFYGCTSLELVVIGTGIKRIGAKAFQTWSDVNSRVYIIYAPEPPQLDMVKVIDVSPFSTVDNDPDNTWYDEWCYVPYSVIENYQEWEGYVEGYVCPICTHCGSCDIHVDSRDPRVYKCNECGNEMY